jgi:dipeptidyl aminopeptidase/acylaminoacyl peptidase
MTTSAPFGNWRSPISAQLISAGATGLGGLASNQHDLFWLETRPLEGGRSVLLRHRDGEPEELTPPPYNVRSRVHEYGGGAFLVTASSAFFVNFPDQNVYRVDLGTGTIEQITDTPTSERYADFAATPGDRSLIAVAERHGLPGRSEAENCLVSIDVASGALTTLCSGHDFYASPRLSPDADQLCYLCWDHPNMPWDGTQLHLADFDEGQLGPATVVTGGADESILQPTWIAPGHLLFASDRSGWWNLYSYDASGEYCIHPDSAEYGAPPWGFNMRSFAVLDARHIACQRIEDGRAQLVILSIDNGILSPLESQWSLFDALTVHDGELFFIGGRPDQLSAIVGHRLGSAERVLARAGTLSIEPDWFSTPEAIEFTTRDGGHAHGYFYPPHNPEFDADDDTAPPVIVVTHGGPTGMTGVALNLRAQYYTSRGWAVFDVNYGGSSGFGRAYRQRLDAQWGIVDVHDCEDGVAELAANGRIDPRRAAIRGGSAGGYTTLAALTFGDRFAAGASHYGIGDLEALARDTHKFESRYLDRLIGPYPEEAQRYQDRSPIHHAEQLDCPVVFFQGLEDAVVPPNQAEAMVEVLRSKGIPVAYVPFEGEQHGFRRAENIVRAIEAEYLFFAKVFGIEPADSIPPLEIENL